MISIDIEKAAQRLWVGELSLFLSWRKPTSTDQFSLYCRYCKRTVMGMSASKWKLIQGLGNEVNPQIARGFLYLMKFYFLPHVLSPEHQQNELLAKLACENHGSVA
jgi:hypothetical protein